MLFSCAQAFKLRLSGANLLVFIKSDEKSGITPLQTKIIEKKDGRSASKSTDSTGLLAKFAVFRRFKPECSSSSVKFRLKFDR